MHGKIKVYVPRESLFSTMLQYEEGHNYRFLYSLYDYYLRYFSLTSLLLCRTIFNIMIAVLLLWGLNIAFDDINFTVLGLPNFDLIVVGFRDIGPFLLHWIVMFLASFSVIYLAHYRYIFEIFLIQYIHCISVNCNLFIYILIFDSS